jgi:hypothetical protein
MRGLFRGILVLGLVCGAASNTDRVAAQQATAARRVVTLADLHMGVGRDRTGAWHPYEDFRWAPEFAAFLRALNDDGNGATDLILNGDTFELWQSTEQDCKYTDPRLGCTEAEALARLERVLTAHATEMQALGEFARTKTNRVVLVPGDHDAALLFPTVARRVLQAIGAPADRAKVMSTGYWLSDDGLIYAEHGHQIGYSANKYDDWPKPFVTQAGKVHLARPWGEQVIQDFFNREELTFPTVDNGSEEGIGLKYGLKAEGATDLGDAASQMVRYSVLRTPWQGMRWDLDAAGDPIAVKWDVAKVRQQGAAFLTNMFVADDLIYPLVSKAAADGRLANTLAQMSDDEIVAVCDYRAAVRRSRRRNEGGLSQFVDRFGPPGSECPRTPETTGTAYKYFWESRDAVFRRHLDAIQKGLPGGGQSIKLVLYAHQHMQDRPANDLHKTPLGFSPNREKDAITAVMVGPWQRTATPVQLDRLKSERNAASVTELLQTLQPEQLAPCYYFVRSVLTDGKPVPGLGAWAQNRQGQWNLSRGCGGGGED